MILEGSFLKKLNDAVDRFAVRHPNFGIPNLMKYIVVGNVVVYFLMLLSNYGSVAFLTFNWGAVLRGELWRLITFIFVPNGTGALSFVLSTYFYYFIGTLLEREWGTPKFNLFYFSGMFLTLLAGIIGYYAPGSATVTGTYYINLSMFLAFAALYPNMQVLLFMVIPIKVKWLAWFDMALFAVDALSAAWAGNYLGALLPMVALLNVVVFFWSAFTDNLAYRRGRIRHQTSRQTIQFKTAARQQQQKEAARGYRHKCAVCGRTDTDSPDLEFRYCSRCAGYHCFCTDHIFSHEHFTE